MRIPLICLALTLGACTTAQLQTAQTDISAGIQAACNDVDAAAKLNPSSPVVAWATGACPLGVAAATLVQNSATLQWLGGIQAQLAAPAAPVAPAA